MKTLVATDQPEFDIRACPIWAIPAIRRILNIKGCTPLYFQVDTETQGTPDARGVLKVHFTDGYAAGTYGALLHKADMNSKGMPALLWELGL